MAKLNIAPTKSNLLAMKEQLAVSTNGYELLEEKISKIPLQYLQELIDFADFLIAKEKKSSANVRKSCFGAMKNKITYIAPDFDAPIEDFAEYM